MVVLLIKLNYLIPPNNYIDEENELKEKLFINLLEKLEIFEKQNEENLILYDVASDFQFL